jgi:hypothetical protein
VNSPIYKNIRPEAIPVNNNVAIRVGTEVPAAPLPLPPLVVALGSRLPLVMLLGRRQRNVDAVSEVVVELLKKCVRVKSTGQMFATAASYMVLLFADVGGKPKVKKRLPVSNSSVSSWKCQLCNLY